MTPRCMAEATPFISNQASIESNTQTLVFYCSIAGGENFCRLQRPSVVDTSLTVRPVGAVGRDGCCPSVLSL